MRHLQMKYSTWTDRVNRMLNETSDLCAYTSVIFWGPEVLGFCCFVSGTSFTFIPTSCWFELRVMFGQSVMSEIYIVLVYRFLLLQLVTSMTHLFMSEELCLLLGWPSVENILCLRDKVSVYGPSQALRYHLELDWSEQVHTDLKIIKRLFGTVLCWL